MSDANFSVRLNYAGPGGAAVQPSIAVVARFEGSLAAAIDIPATTTSGTVYEVPFGSVASPTGVLIKNDSDKDLGIRINGAEANEFQLPAGGIFCVASAEAALANPITALEVVTTATHTVAGKVSCYVLGDPVALP